MTAGHRRVPGPGRLRPFASLRWPRAPFSAGERVALGGLVLLLLGVVAYVAYEFHPVSGPPTGSDLERQIASAFAPPSESAFDSNLKGDLLVERFYILDARSGDRYVGDFVKGRIEGIQQLPGNNGLSTTMALLDLANLKRDRALYSAYVSAVAPPDERDGSYLGLSVPTGKEDAIPFNYTGLLPAAHEAFVGPNGEDLSAFLLKQDYKDVTAAPRIVPVNGYNFVLSDSDVFPLFKNQYGLDHAVFLSELLVVDATASVNRGVMYRLLSQYPLSPSH